MKRILPFLIVLIYSTINAQIISNTDAAVLFSGNDNYGTARFESLGGAFGALGGDMSAGEVNPAGLGVFFRNQSSLTLAYRNTDINTSFYGTNRANNDQYLNFSQAGGVLVFDVPNDANWQSVSLGFNYSIVNDFSNNFLIEGNSGTPDFLDDPFLNLDNDNTNDVFYNNVDGQSFINTTNGLNEKFSFSLAANHNDKIYYGISFSSYNFEYNQIADLAEFNNDGNGNTLDASLIQTLSTSGNGFSIGLGILAKPTDVLRLGLSYHSPTWYVLTDVYSDDLQLTPSNASSDFSDVSNGIYDYKLSTPSTATASLAYLFGKMGLVSVDYTFKDYQNTKLRPSSSFNTENQYLSTNLRGTSQIKIGTEWRFAGVSLRGGYLYEQNPYAGSPNSDDKTGYSLGFGFHVAQHSKFDVAYTNTTQAQPYAFLQASDSGNLNINNQRITATFVIGF